MRKVRETERRKQQIAIHRSVFDVTFFHIKIEPNKFSFLLLWRCLPIPVGRKFCAFVNLCCLFLSRNSLSLAHILCVALSWARGARVVCANLPILSEYYRYHSILLLSRGQKRFMLSPIWHRWRRSNSPSPLIIHSTHLNANERVRAHMDRQKSKWTLHEME